MITEYPNRDNPKSMNLHEISMQTGIRYTTLQHLVRQGVLKKVPTTRREIEVTTESVKQYLDSQNKGE